MRKGLILFVFIALLMGGYATWWSNLADSYEKKLARSLEEANIHFSSISKSGFPFSITLNVVDPYINETSAGSLSFASSLKGLLSFSKPLWNNLITINLKGDHLLRFNGKRGNMVGKLNVNGLTSLALHSEFDTLFGPSNEKKSQLRQLTLHSLALSWPDAKFYLMKANFLESNLKNTRLALTRRNGHKDTYDFTLNIPEINLRKADHWEGIVFSSTMFDDTGKAFAKGSLTLPQNQSDPLDNQDLYFALAIDTLSVQDQVKYYDLHDFLIDLTLKGEKENKDEGPFSGSINLHGKSTAQHNKACFDLIEQEMIEKIKVTAGVLFRDSPIKAEKFTNNAHEIARDLAPILASCETQAVDFDIQSNFSRLHFIDNNPFSPEGLPETIELKIKKLLLGLGKYALSVSGDLEYSSIKNQERQNGSFTLKLNDFPSAVNEVNKIYNTFAKISFKFTPDIIIIRPSQPENVQLAIEFLRAISDNPGSSTDDFTTTVAFDKENGLHIGSNNTEKLLELWQQLLMGIMMNYYPNVKPLELQ